MARAARAVAGAALALAALATAAAAQSKTGSTFGSFLLIEPSARLAAMGNAGVGAAGGLDAVYYNPAAIGLLARPAVNVTHSAWFADISFDYVAAALPLGRWGTAFTSVTSLNSGDIDVRTVDHPLGTGERFSVSDVSIGLGYGKQITDRFSMGVQLSYVQESIWHSSAQTAVLGFGTLYQTSDHGLRLGASLSNFGTQAAFAGRDLHVTFDADPNSNGDNGTLPAAQATDDFALPVLFRVGVGLPVRIDDDHELRVEADAFHPSDNAESMSLGAELHDRRGWALRWGYQNLFLHDAEGGLAIGAGYAGDVSRRHVSLDYGWADHGRLGNVHRLSLGFQF